VIINFSYSILVLFVTLLRNRENMRLDHYLFYHKFTQSRNQAKALINDGKIAVNGVVVLKPSYTISEIEKPNIEILKEKLYVSRAAEKLKSFLQNHPLEIKDKVCLDIGSSTGGFIQVLLEYGAAEVTGVDVGKEQLHELLQHDSRVISIEETDIRDFQTSRKFDIVTCDVSFVGIGYILKDIDRLAQKDIILLFKPQFEVGKEVKRTKKGVVKDQHAVAIVQEKLESEIFKMGWELIMCQNSQVKGKEGNAEIFYHFRKKR
jgi:23S rRNA (cytidine1920-2'-O)/16S rRNA (cytidine1409-2'-O)-methyltransferase